MLTVVSMSIRNLSSLANRTIKVVEYLDAMRDRLTAMQEHLDVQHSIQIGRNSYVLSVVAAIFLPLGFITGLFGVNLAGMPGGDWQPAFAVLSAASVGIAIFLFFFFRWLKWL